MRTDLSVYNNSAFQKSLPGLVKRGSWFLVNWLFFRSPVFASYSVKRRLLKMFGARVGKGVIIKPSVNIKYAWNLTIGDHVWIGEGVWIDNLAQVTIGSNVCISQGAMLLTGNHNYSKKEFDLMVSPILLEDGCWVGAKSVVCPGVNCRSHSVLTVQSVAIRDMDPYGIYQGNPATFVKERIIE